MISRALIFTCVFNLARNEDSPFSRKTLEESWEEQLMKDLKSRDVSQYAPNVTTDINLHYFLKHFTMGEDETTFTAFSWLILSWNDYRLKWKEEDYYGITEVIFSRFTKFWQPTLLLLNEEVDMQEYAIPFGMCRLNKDGDIFCIPRVLHKAPCHTKLTNWPYDVQSCAVQMGLFTIAGNINIVQVKKIVTLFGAEYGGEWTIVNYTEQYKSVVSPVRHSDMGSQLDVTFLLAREGEGLGAIVVVPTFLLTILTLCSFLLNVKDNFRLGIICFNLLCHFLFLTELSDLIPKHSEDSPTILFYLRDSVMINILLVIFTMFLIELRKKTVPTPSWISIINGIVLKGGGRFLIWPRWRADRDASDEIQVISNQWADFSDILNSFGLFLVILLYSFYVCAYIPRPTSNYEF
ncbi:neuronal acetylcholine receptor subunit alpha-3-like [Plodia interpunctella]|uniref:neuronal acetylcholine receptor subunit alpha-3-like n=1 Tax=Plodia interpunctella TaxID=58824 RepID=UPI002367BCAC|nr:neuronal acetylcholine receptor subunit alpha-3-like [Plodia interpunctella]